MFCWSWLCTWVYLDMVLGKRNTMIFSLFPSNATLAALYIPCVFSCIQSLQQECWVAMFLASVVFSNNLANILFSVSSGDLDPPSKTLYSNKRILWIPYCGHTQITSPNSTFLQRNFPPHALCNCFPSLPYKLISVVLQPFHVLPESPLHLPAFSEELTCLPLNHSPHLHLDLSENVTEFILPRSHVINNFYLNFF